jgi:hypothetical protein
LVDGAEQGTDVAEQLVFRHPVVVPPPDLLEFPTHALPPSLVDGYRALPGVELVPALPDREALKTDRLLATRALATGEGSCWKSARERPEVLVVQPA